MSGGSGGVAAVVLLAAMAGGTEVSAHRLDEYLQAARIAIEPKHADIQLDVTPGAALAAVVLASIDGDGDGALSEEEQRAYVAGVLGAVFVEVDGWPLPLRPGAVTFPEPAAFRRGEAAIRIAARAALPSLADGEHQLRFRNTHQPPGSVYLANALVPASDRVAVTTQRRDARQTQLTIDFVTRAGRDRSVLAWVFGSAFAAVALAGLVRRRRPQAPAVAVTARARHE